MNRLKILPGAAGVIAMTATLGFIDGKCEEFNSEIISRGRVTLVEPITNTAGANNVFSNNSDLNQYRPIYLVEIRRGNKVEEVKIDCASGKMLS